MESTDWSNLPDHIVVQVMQYLHLEDRYKASLACKSWNSCFQLPYLWRYFTCQFNNEGDARYLSGLKAYGKHVKSLDIKLDQSIKSNRLNSCTVIDNLAEEEERKKLQNLKIKFTGENPLFYAGGEIVNSLKNLFGTQTVDGEKSFQCLKEVDLSGLTVMFDEKMFEILAENHPDLEVLNMQNKVLICKVTPSCISNIVRKCRKLKELHMFMSNITDEILFLFTEDDRKPLKILSLLSRREEKYGKDLSDDAWKILQRKLQDLRVHLIFDHTCPLHKVNEIMCPSIPVSVLRLETFTNISDQINIAARYYKTTLQKLVVNTSMSRHTSELNKAILDLVTDCKALKSLHVFCVLDKTTVEKILALLPDMAARNSYTLKYTPEPHPWVAGKDALP